MTTDEQRISRPIASCALDAAGLRAQRDRYGRLAASVLSVRREPAALEVSFAPDVDRDVLERTLVVERECCPFFRFELDESRAQLRVSVTRVQERPALEVLAEAFAGGPRRQTSRG